jgi:ADP-ribose pyrophosphatase
MHDDRQPPDALPAPAPAGAGVAWTELRRETVYARFGRSVVEADFLLPSGTVETYSLRVDRPTVAVLALDEAGRVLLTRQYRPGPGRFLTELPGGYLDDGESPAAAAARELAEETGYAGRVEVVGHCYGDSYSSALKHCAVARDCRLVGEPRPEPTEFIEVTALPLPDFRALLRSGEMTDVDLAYLGLDALGLL